MHFKDRRDAGRQLARRLIPDYKDAQVIVYALPRGGVVVADEIAKALHAPLDLIFAHKIGHPHQSEYAVAALSESGQMVGDSPELRSFGEKWLEKEKMKQREEFKQRRQLYLKGRNSLSAQNKVALQVAAALPQLIGSVVSRGGRPDLAMAVLDQVIAPTLLIVGGNDFGVIELNQKAYEKLTCEKELTIIAHATHLFEEPGCLEEVARVASHWFNQTL